MPSFRSLALALSLLPAYVAAQEAATDTTGFRAGQWGVQLGAGYWVTPNLSLGATGSVGAGYTHQLQDNGNVKTEQNGWSAGGVHVLFAIGLYF